MADFVPNAALGRTVELYRRVQSGVDPNGALVVIALAAAGIETDAVLKDKPTLVDWLSGSTNEVANSGYARKVLLAAELAPYAPDHVNDRVDLDLPDLAWTGVAAGDEWAKLVIAYTPDTTTGTDADLIPLSCHDFPIIPDGSDIVAQISSAGFYRAQ